MRGKKLISIILTAAALLVLAEAITGAGMAASGGIVYSSSAYGFTLTLPSGWAGLYRVKEETNGPSFINIRNENAGYGGFVCGIYISDNTNPVEWGYKELARSGGKYYYGATPSDVQFNYSDESMRNEYTVMEKDISSIFSSFRLISTGVTASPTTSTVLVNGKNVSFDAYNIGGNNYFKLRDLAYALSGSRKQFDIAWDGARNIINLYGGAPYTIIGGEMETGKSGNKTATPTSSRIFLDGWEMNFTAYNIGGNNYFKLRDIGASFDFGVDWDGARNTIVIDTDKGYISESGSTGLYNNNSDRTNKDRDFYHELVGMWHASRVLGSGWSSRLALLEGYTFIYAANQMDEGAARDRFITGAWGVSSDGILTLYCYEALRMEGGKYVKVKHDPVEKIEVIVGNYVYSISEPHPWSISIESFDSILYGWWYRYEAQQDLDDLLNDYAIAAAT